MDSDENAKKWDEGSLFNLRRINAKTGALAMGLIGLGSVVFTACNHMESIKEQPLEQIVAGLYVTGACVFSGAMTGYLNQKVIIPLGDYYFDKIDKYKQREYDDSP